VCTHTADHCMCFLWCELLVVLGITLHDYAAVRGSQCCDNPAARPRSADICRPTRAYRVAAGRFVRAAARTSCELTGSDNLCSPVCARHVYTISLSKLTFYKQ
jgi:hypothetical protein